MNNQEIITKDLPESFNKLLIQEAIDTVQDEAIIRVGHYKDNLLFVITDKCIWKFYIIKQTHKTSRCLFSGINYFLLRRIDNSVCIALSSEPCEVMEVLFFDNIAQACEYLKILYELQVKNDPSIKEKEYN